MSTPPLVRLRSASFGYADRTVVSEVDLAVDEREVVALLGPNGSGKSTLVRGILLGEDSAVLDDFRAAVVDAAAPFRTADGYLLRNAFRWAVGGA